LGDGGNLRLSSRSAIGGFCFLIAKSRLGFEQVAHGKKNARCCCLFRTMLAAAPLSRMAHPHANLRSRAARQQGPVPWSGSPLVKVDGCTCYSFKRQNVRTRARRVARSYASSGSSCGTIHPFAPSSLQVQSLAVSHQSSYSQHCWLKQSLACGMRRHHALRIN
jgi:hypothetical protein